MSSPPSYSEDDALCSSTQGSPTAFIDMKPAWPGADPGFRRGGGFVQEFRLENRSYPDVHDFSLRMQVIITNDYVAFDLRKVTIDLKILEFIVLLLMEVEYV